MIAQAVPAETGDLAAMGRALVATVLGFAAFAKVRDWGEFRAVLRFVAPRAPGPWVQVLAVGVVGLEVVLAGMLVTGIGIAAGAWGSVGFLCAATLALVVLRRRGYEGGCACFGERSATGPVGWLDLVRNAVLIAVALAVARWYGTAPPLWEFSPAVIGLGAAAIAGILLTYAMVHSMVAVQTAVAAARAQHAPSIGESPDEARGRVL